MKPCPEDIVRYMHDYLDGEITRRDEQILKEHLEKCPECQQHMDGLSRSVAFLKSAAPIEAPEGLASGIMASLPKERQGAGVRRWFGRHPMLAAVAMFVLLAGAALLSNFNTEDQFAVSRQPNLVVEGNKVTVPEGETVKGDLVVKNGELHIEGEVEGNVMVINGSKYMASTAIVTGQVEEINQAFEWLWYKIKAAVKDSISFFEGDGGDGEE
ncbi:anti-sigma factor family protein [Edaphobacillus lindanitolerans]|uniref:Anti-sigma-W factor RsiW n=1 Tax=Edaphobacillus lindanitolerans TaxID=550447 RepID=A0A1U7PNT2_9BACI|nr:anti-sigma factor [Edaphobacillus lindanitolerans]SIT88123.1 Transmembrane transcriptional regulator (anti-sigma factor RsiW) [Edaphobacillus lindanitolerans]